MSRTSSTYFALFRGPDVVSISLACARRGSMSCSIRYVEACDDFPAL